MRNYGKSHRIKMLIEKSLDEGATVVVANKDGFEVRGGNNMINVTPEIGQTPAFCEICKGDHPTGFHVELIENQRRRKKGDSSV